VNRRAFAESLAVAALAPVVGAPAGVLRAGMLRLDPRPFGTAADPDFPGRPSTAGASSLALALAEIVRLRYGGRLSGGELAAITHQIQAGLDRADLIRRAEQGDGV
jgi:hypothetical protein